jgi:hypothetical protein
MKWKTTEWKGKDGNWDKRMENEDVQKEVSQVR